MAHDGIRGRVVGNVMSGLMLGIMLARPVASLVADIASWQAVYLIAALAMLVMLAVLRLALPLRQPHSPMGYRALMASMVDLALQTPVLRLRALCHACLFASFSLFWTVVPQYLAQRFAMPQRGIALYALAGVAGAIAAPLAGRMADRGWTRPATLTAMLLVAVALLLAQLELGSATAHIALLVAVAIVLDAGVSSHLVLSQRVIFALGATQRGRCNALFMATFFAGGAIGSAVGGWSYAQGGWSTAAWVALAFPLLALILFMAARNSRAA
jgi:predicted MFS family arabinose efflux permease